MESVNIVINSILEQIPMDVSSFAFYFLLYLFVFLETFFKESNISFFLLLTF